MALHQSGMDPQTGRSTRCARRALRRFGRAERGVATVEYMILVGFCAFVGIVAFYRYGVELHRNLRYEAALIEAKALPNLELMDWLMREVPYDDWEAVGGDLLSTGSSTLGSGSPGTGSSTGSTGTSTGSP